MQTERGESRFVPNTVALVVQTVAATLLTLLQVKLLANYLSKETFGLFASMRGLSLLLATLAAHGLPQLLVRFIPVHESRRERAAALRLVAGGALLSLAGLAAAVAVTQAFERPVFRFVPPGTLTTGLLFWFYATTLGVMLKLVLYGGLNGLRRLASQVMIETLSLLAVLAWLFAARHDLTLASLFRILGVVNLAAVAAGYAVLFGGLGKAVGARAPTGGADGGGSGKQTDFSQGETRPNASTYRPEYTSYLLWAAGLSLVAIAFSDADRYLLAQILSLELLAAFHVGARVGRLANRLLGVANLAFQPEVTRLDTEGRRTRVAESTRIFLKFNTILSVWMAAALIVFAREVIVVVASAEYAAAVPLLVLFALSLPLSTMTAPLTSVMKAVDQVRGALWCDLGWALCYVGLILALASPLGLNGVGIAQVLACAIQLALALAISKLPGAAGAVAGLAWKLLVSGAAAFVPVWLVGAALSGSPAGVVVAAKAAAFVVGSAIFRFLVRFLRVLGDDERGVVFSMLESRRMGFVGGLVGISGFGRAK
jgi:O-antigen/teichoic acid export membrane protein